MKIIFLPYHNNYILINENDRIIKKEYKYQKGIVTSTLKYNKILNINFKLPKTIEKELLEIEAEKYLFTEGSLDYSKEYNIVYLFKEFRDFINVEAFVAEIENLKEEFNKHIKTFKYIDFISPAPFVFEAFYDIASVKPQNDLFVYFEEDEAFVSCFVNKEFMFVKSLSKLNVLAKSLNLSIEETKELLKKKGVDEFEYENLEQYRIIESFFSELFMKINHIINFSSSNYKIQKIDNIYFYAPFEIKAFFKNYKKFWSSIGIEFQKYRIDTDYNYFEYTAAFYNSKNYQKDEINFSAFKRKKPIYKTKPGQLMLFSLFLILLIILDIGYKYYVLNVQQKTFLSLKAKIAKKERHIKLIKNIYTRYEKRIEVLKKEEIKIKNQIDKIGKNIEFLYILSTKRPFCNDLANISNLLAKYKLNLVSFNKKNIHFELVLKSKFDLSANIARFMKELAKIGYKNISSKTILNEDKKYIAKVSFDG